MMRSVSVFGQYLCHVGDMVRPLGYAPLCRNANVSKHCGTYIDTLACLISTDYYTKTANLCFAMQSGKDTVVFTVRTLQHDLLTPQLLSRHRLELLTASRHSTLEQAEAFATVCLSLASRANNAVFPTTSAFSRAIRI